MKYEQGILLVGGAYAITFSLGTGAVGGASGGIKNVDTAFNIV